jgi:hypothetical protein
MAIEKKALTGKKAVSKKKNVTKAAQPAAKLTTAQAVPGMKATQRMM